MEDVSDTAFVFLPGMSLDDDLEKRSTKEDIKCSVM
jgi:hypothetical protein